MGHACVDAGAGDTGYEQVAAPDLSTWGRPVSVSLFSYGKVSFFFSIVIEHKIKCCLEFHNVGSSCHVLLTVVSSF